MTPRRTLQAPPREPEPRICVPDTPLQRLCMVAAILFLMAALLLLAPNPTIWP